MADEMSTEMATEMSVDNIGEQYSIFLGEENNTQYWFVISSNITPEAVKYVAKSIVYGMVSVSALGDDSILYNCVEEPNIVKPTLVMLYGKIGTENKDEDKEFIISRGDEENDDNISKYIVNLINLSFKFMREYVSSFGSDSIAGASSTNGKITAKTIVRTKEYIKVEEAIIDEDNIKYLGSILIDLQTRYNKDKSVRTRSISY